MAQVDVVPDEDIEVVEAEGFSPLDYLIPEMAKAASAACGNSILQYVAMSTKIMKRDVREHGTRKTHAQFIAQRQQREVSFLMFKSTPSAHIPVVGRTMKRTLMCNKIPQLLPL